MPTFEIIIEIRNDVKVQVVKSDQDLIKCTTSPKAIFQSTFGPILMAIIAFCAKSVNNPKTPLIPRQLPEEARSKKGSQAKKNYQVKSSTRVMILLFLVTHYSLHFFVKQLLLIGFSHHFQRQVKYVTWQGMCHSNA